MQPCGHETFWTLLRDGAHWEFELFLIVVVDLIILGVLWPIFRRHWKHHKERDAREGVPECGRDHDGACHLHYTWRGYRCKR